MISPTVFPQLVAEMAAQHRQEIVDDFRRANTRRFVLRRARNSTRVS
jgi:hypothetical protein